jgi:PQQ-dependent catabolism-associated CXXCW motif protein
MKHSPADVLGMIAYLAALAFAILASAALAGVPEPQGYWMGPMHSEVPATLSGAGVIHTPALAELVREGRAVLIDAASVPRKPENLAPEVIWKPVPHENIPGSFWIPGIGEGNIEKNIEVYFRERLSALTGNDLDRPVIFFCHLQCWASWNAAKRAISYGYRKISWYPDGAEGWRDAGHAVAAAEPETPPLSGH